MAKRITIVLSALCVIITLFAWYSNPEQIFSNYGYSTENMMAGDYYVLLSSIFLHSNLDHLLSNLIVLLIFGFALEEEIRGKRFLLVFLGGAFLGDLLTSLIYPYSQICVGASAGVFSIMAATILIKPIKMEVFVPMPLGIIGIGYLIYGIIGFIANYPPHVAHIAHMGGAFVGLFYGFRYTGSKKALRILIAMFLLFMFTPFIWNFWVLLINSIIG